MDAEPPSEDAKCGMCGGCGTMPPWAPEMLANATASQRIALEQRMRAAQRAFLDESESRVAALCLDDAFSTSPDEDTSALRGPATSVADTPSDGRQGGAAEDPAHSHADIDTATPAMRDDPGSAARSPKKAGASADLGSDAESFHTASDEDDGDNDSYKEKRRDASAPADARHLAARARDRDVGDAGVRQGARDADRDVGFGDDVGEEEVASLSHLPAVSTDNLEGLVEARRAFARNQLRTAVPRRATWTSARSFEPWTSLSAHTAAAKEAVNPSAAAAVATTTTTATTATTVATATTATTTTTTTAIATSTPTTADASATTAARSPSAERAPVRAAPADREVIVRSGRDAPTCGDCMQWRGRVQELEMQVEALTATLSARERDVTSLRARVSGEGRKCSKGEARLRQECEGLKVTTEFLVRLRVFFGSLSACLFRFVVSFSSVCCVFFYASSALTWLLLSCQTALPRASSASWSATRGRRAAALPTFINITAIRVIAHVHAGLGL